jgi:hypothetical protein
MDDDFLPAGENQQRSSSKYQLWWKNAKEILFEFHDYSYDINKKPYMITQCKHVFHTQCLENWFKQKKECPFCRQEITNINN